MDKLKWILALVMGIALLSFGFSGIKVLNTDNSAMFVMFGFLATLFPAKNVWESNIQTRACLSHAVMHVVMFSAVGLFACLVFGYTIYAISFMVFASIFFEVYAFLALRLPEIEAEHKRKTLVNVR